MNRPGLPPFRLLALAPVAWWLAVAAASAGDRNASFRAALESITSRDLQEHVDYLAQESLEGREAGTRGGHAAADYLAAQLAKLRLRGAGVDGGYFQPFAPNFRNVLAWIEGSDPKRKAEFLILGGHYDHVGRGTVRNSRGTVGLIHPGADDNASGTSAVLRLARAFSLLAEPPRRSVLFAFWDAEEKVMLGSKHWLAHPTIARDRAVMLFNLDMVGRLRGDRLIVVGTRTGAGLRRLVCQQNQGFGLRLDLSWQMLATGDHYPFFQAGIPLLMFHTDTHEDYHRNSDVARLINSEGMERVVRLVFSVAYELAQQEQVPAFREASRLESSDTQRLLLQSPGALPDRLGAGWEPTPAPEGGVRLTWTVVGSPAQRAGLQSGDRIVRFAGRDIATGDDLQGAILGAKSPAAATVHRFGRAQPLELTVPLDGEPMRLGITWRLDDAEPGTIVLTRVVPGSPAARAGLQPGDRVYQLNGQDFGDDQQFAERAKTLPGPLRLLVERDGQLRVVEVHFEAVPVRRAA